MATVSVKDEYLEILTALGDVQAAMDLALQRYAVEQITAKIAALRRQDQQYQAKYGMDYPTFVTKCAADENFIQLQEANGNKLWEIDLSDWEFCYKWRRDWTEKLQSILLS